MKRFNDRWSVVLVLFVVTMVGCARATDSDIADYSLRFEPAFEKRSECHGVCREHRVLMPLGNSTVVFSPESPALTVSSTHVVEVRAVTSNDSPQILLFKLDNDALTELAQWIDTNSESLSEYLMLSLDNVELGAFHFRLLKVMGGSVGVSVADETLRVIEAKANLTEIDRNTESSSLDQSSMCAKLAKGDPKLLQHCLDLATKDFAKESAAIDRAEAELDKEHPDYEAALRDLGVEVRPGDIQPAPEAPGAPH